MSGNMMIFVIDNNYNQGLTELITSHLDGFVMTTDELNAEIRASIGSRHPCMEADSMHSAVVDILIGIDTAISDYLNIPMVYDDYDLLMERYGTRRIYFEVTYNKQIFVYIRSAL